MIIENVSVKNSNISWTWCVGGEAEVTIYARRWDMEGDSGDIRLNHVYKQTGIAISSAEIPQEKVEPGIYQIILIPSCSNEVGEEIILERVAIGGIFQVGYQVKRYGSREIISQITFLLAGVREVPGNHFMVYVRSKDSRYALRTAIKNGSSFLMYGVSAADIEVVATEAFKGSYKIERKGV